MKKYILITFVSSLILNAEGVNIPDILVETSAEEEEALIVMQETTPGMKQPVINGLMGDKILITVDNNKFSNSLFRSGPNQYYSWILDEFVLSNSINTTLLNSSLGGTVNRTLGIDTSGVSIEASGNTFRESIKYADDTVQAGAVYTNNENVVTPYDGEVAHSAYNQKGLYVGLNTDIGISKLMFSQSNDIDRTDKFEKGDYYVYELQRFFLLSHQYKVTDSNILIMPSLQQFREKIDRDSPNKKNIDSTNNIFGLNISNKHEALFASTDIFKYGLTDHYEDINYIKGVKETDYYYNTLSLWASYHNNISENWDYTLTYNFANLVTKGGDIDRNMNGNAFGLVVDYYFDESSYLYGSINSNFKFPTITNLAEARSDSVDEIPNPNLESEKALTGRVGLQYQGLDLSLFYKKLHNMIIRVETAIPDGQGEYKWRYENTDNGYIKGISFAYMKTFFNDYKVRLNAELLDGKTDYDYISKLQPVVTSSYLQYKDLWLEFLYAPSVDEDKMALKDQKDIRIKDHNYGYKVLNTGYVLNYDQHIFNFYLDNIFDSRGRVYGSSVDFNERRVRLGYSYQF